VKTRYTLLGDTTVEVVVDGESIEVNILPAPALGDAPENHPVQELSSPEPEPAPEPEAPLTKKKRTLMGVIRASWFVIFSAVGEALTYALNNLTTLNLPPGTATGIGAVGYGVKRAFWPNTVL
jgi:hypothetical protein